MKGLNEQKKYIEENDFKNMSLYQSTEYKQIGVYSFIYEEDDVKIYPDSLEVKIALDNGDILGLTTKKTISSIIKKEIYQHLI